MKVAYCLLLLVINTSCVVNLVGKKGNTGQALNKNDLSKFNGTYGVLSLNKVHRTLDQAFWHDNKRGVYKVKIKVLSPKRLQVTTYDARGKVATKIVKGRFSQGYFVVKKMYKAQVGCFINGFVTKKARLTILKNGNLLADIGTAGFSFLIVLPVGSGGGTLNNLEFPRIE